VPRNKVAVNTPPFMRAQTLPVDLEIELEIGVPLDAKTVEDLHFS
jgi:hypothetical protein